MIIARKSKHFKAELVSKVESIMLQVNCLFTGKNNLSTEFVNN